MAKSPKKICVKFFTVGNKRSTTSIIRAGKGKVFTPKGIDQCLETFANALERRMPNEEFRLICVGLGCYNFVWQSSKELGGTFDCPHCGVDTPHEHNLITGLVDDGQATVDHGD